MNESVVFVSIQFNWLPVVPTMKKVIVYCVYLACLFTPFLACAKFPESVILSNIAFLFVTLDIRTDVASKRLTESESNTGIFLLMSEPVL